MILSHFAELSGMWVNWEKSLIMLIDLWARGAADPTLLLTWMDSLHYLGINISSNVLDFSKQNLYPLLLMIKQKLKAWENLPLSLIGKKNVVKIKILIYNLQHSSIWVSKAFLNN